jgi:hypothetical protein
MPALPAKKAVVLRIVLCRIVTSMPTPRMIQVRCLKCHDRVADVSEDATGRLEIVCRKKRRHTDGQSYTNVIERMQDLPVIVHRQQKPVASQIAMR